MELNDQLVELFEPSFHNSTATANESCEAMDISGMANQFNTSLQIGNQETSTQLMDSVKVDDQPMPPIATSTPLRPAAARNPAKPSDTEVHIFNLSKLSEFGSTEFDGSLKPVVENTSSSTTASVSLEKKRQKTSKGFKASLSIPIGDSSSCSEPRRSSRVSTSSLNLHLSSDSSLSSTFEAPQPVSSKQNASSILSQSVTSSKSNTTASVIKSSPAAPSPALTRSKSRVVSTSSSGSNSKAAPPARSNAKPVKRSQSNRNISDSTILANIGMNAHFSEQEQQLLNDINFNAKKMWNEKNMCWMNASLTGVSYTLKEVDVVFPLQLFQESLGNLRISSQI